jgi:hypothetical protein
MTLLFFFAESNGNGTDRLGTMATPLLGTVFEMEPFWFGCLDNP